MKKAFFIIFFLGIFFAEQVFASDFFVSNSPAEIYDQDELFINVYIDAQEKTLNAAAGKINVPKEFFVIKEIIDGDSDINFWVEKPFINSQNQIQFSGIVPNGFTGRIKILSAILTAKKIGQTTIAISQPEALLNDGAGTPDNINAQNLNLEIKPKTEGQMPLAVYLEDREPPEAFTPEIMKIPAIYDNNYTLVFLAQDKLSGIEQYKILEERNYRFWGVTYGIGTWKDAASPYRLNDQKLKSDIYVKAIDKLGNERTVHVPAAQPIYWYENFLIWSIIILVAVTILVIFGIYVYKQKR